MGIITYDKSLVEALTSHQPLPPGSDAETSIRAASILAVDAVCHLINHIRAADVVNGHAKSLHAVTEVTNVLIDFFLWDLAKELGNGRMALPAHRTRSIWY